ncbi:Nuclear pore complex protein Nup50 [Varanus komodoensis]|nr:Nuclear pore complex protein Nup50 [Varanus komodoensis]
MRKVGLDESQVGIKIAGRNINNLRYADNSTLMAESEEELKSLLMWVKEESAKVGLKFNFKKTKIMASGPLTSWQIDGEEMELVSDFIFLGSKITTDGDCSQEIKRCFFLGREVMANLDSILKSRDITLAAEVCIVKAMVFPVAMYGCESWTISSVVSSGSVNNIVVEKKPTNVEANGESRQLLSSGFTQSKACSSDIYHKQLAALNCSVRDWIVKHVNANPLCDLTPIFQDYEKYLVEIEQHGTSSDSGDSESDNIKAVGSQAGSASGSSNLQQGSTFFFNTNKSEDTSGKKMELEKKMEPKLGSTSSVSFTFSQSVDSSGVSSGALPSFSFSSGSTGLFGKDANQGKVVPSFSSNSLDTQTESGVNEEKGGEDEEEEPPKAVVNEIKEEDAFYSKKCKVFYKKDNEFKEKGVGTLHLKPAGNQKTQLLIRADTNLGNILLNILVPPKMPCSRTGKNNVLIVCVPNPPIDEKNATTPVPMLIRVKTSEDADELHNILLEKKDV